MYTYFIETSKYGSYEMAKLVVLLLTPRTYLPMEIFSFSKGFRLYKSLIKCESLFHLNLALFQDICSNELSQAQSSPNLFKFYINGLIDDFDHSYSPVLLGQKHISCLLYADDLVLLSESQEGLQNCLNKTWE
jgi:hypothetical protein